MKRVLESVIVIFFFSWVGCVVLAIVKDKPIFLIGVPIFMMLNICIGVFGEGLGYWESLKEFSEEELEYLKKLLQEEWGE